MKSMTINMKCPNCGARYSEQLGRMNSGNQHKCTRCNVVIKYDGDGGRKAQRALDNFSKSLTKMFK